LNIFLDGLCHNKNCVNYRFAVIYAEHKGNTHERNDSIFNN
jgi:hypothetical protein